jgi:hypothetical protein
MTPRGDSAIDKEIEFHVEQHVADLIAAGVAPDEARRRARMELGGVTQVAEACRERRFSWLLAGLSQDVRYALRLMRRSPAFTAVAILSLALGTGANTAIFSLVDTLMLRSLPVDAPDRLVELLSRYPGEPDMNGFSWRVYEHFRDSNHVFSDLFGISPGGVRANVEGSDAQTTDVLYVAGGMFHALGLRPALGRLFEASDTRSISIPPSSESACSSTASRRPLSASPRARSSDWRSVRGPTCGCPRSSSRSSIIQAVRPTGNSPSA